MMKTKIKSLLLAVIFTVISCITLTANATDNIPDADGDGRISISDAVAIRMYLAGQHCPTQPDAYDTDRNGIISYMDARCTEMYLAQTWSGNGIGSSSNIGDSNTSVRYNVYDSTTGDFLRAYTLSPLASRNNSRAIIGNDDRVIDWTKSGTVKIISQSGAPFTGFVVDSHTIATAAHCLLDSATSIGRPLSDVLLFDSNGNVSLHATPVESHLPTSYVTDTQNYRDVDYALLTVEEDLSDYACFNLGVTSDWAKLINKSVSVTGFPNSSNNTNLHMMYTGNGIIDDIDINKVCYTNDTSGGNSGSPVYVTETINGNTFFTVIAIHTAKNSSTTNRGTRIDTDILHFYKNNPNLNW